MVAVWAIAGVVGFSLLSAPHVHPAGIEGRQHSLVHQHSLAHFSSASGGMSIAGAHGDHNRALFLTVSYDSISRFVPHVPAVVDATTAILPSLGPMESVQTNDAHPAHGPPESTDPARAPPVEV